MKQQLDAAKPAFLAALTLCTTLLVGGCTASVSSPSSSDQIIADPLLAFVTFLASLGGVFSIILGVLFVIVGFLWMIMPFFVWRIAVHSKRSAVRAQFIYKTLHRLEVISARMEARDKHLESMNTVDRVNDA